jgi:hypothetical protein
MIDATLERPFFRRNPDGTVMYPSEAGFASELGALEALPEEAVWGSDEEDEEEFESCSEGEDSDSDGSLQGVSIRVNRMSMGHKPVRASLRNDASAEPAIQTPGRRAEPRARRRGAAEDTGPRTRVDFKLFETCIWPRMQRKLPAKGVSASSVFQEIQSFIKVLARCIHTTRTKCFHRRMYNECDDDDRVLRDAASYQGVITYTFQLSRRNHIYLSVIKA